MELFKKINKDYGLTIYSNESIYHLGQDNLLHIGLIIHLDSLQPISEALPYQDRLSATIQLSDDILLGNCVAPSPSLSLSLLRRINARAGQSSPP